MKYDFLSVSIKLWKWLTAKEVTVPEINKLKHKYVQGGVHEDQLNLFNSILIIAYLMESSQTLDFAQDYNITNKFITLLLALNTNQYIDTGTIISW